MSSNNDVPEYVFDLPEYVFDLLDAFITQKPLNFHEHEVPRAVQEILEKAKKEGILKEVAIESF